MTSRNEERDRARAARQERERGEAAARERARRRRLLLGAGGLIVAIVAAVVAVGAFKKDPTDGASTARVDGVEVRGGAETAALLRGLPQHGETLGDPDAPVTILEIADLKCPGCQAHEVQTQKAVVDRLVRTGKANLELQLVNYRDAAAGTSDGAAARRAAYNFAGKDRFWNFVHAAYYNQGQETTAWASERTLRRIAAAAPGIDPAGVDVRETPRSRAAIARADALAAALRNDQTPALYVQPRGRREYTRLDDGATSDVDALEAAVAKATARARG
ncbi:thioredoxin domain-containing protein [Patulibacter sp. SYSU D01012]|uniref:thioredoxin domain-containing protein n=1 Tax=Patulibacter sp. SYSU D01012 TaxID=2817381 RepID=UPI001B3032DA|nr:thioredoxin domain-containing protein [Patulibacter sp. SYSU D01012]